MTPTWQYCFPGWPENKIKHSYTTHQYYLKLKQNIQNHHLIH